MLLSSLLFVFWQLSKVLHKHWQINFPGCLSTELLYLASYAGNLF